MFFGNRKGGSQWPTGSVDFLKYVKTTFGIDDGKEKELQEILLILEELKKYLPQVESYIPGIADHGAKNITNYLTTLLQFFKQQPNLRKIDVSELTVFRGHIAGASSMMYSYKNIVVKTVKKGINPLSGSLDFIEEGNDTKIASEIGLCPRAFQGFCLLSDGRIGIMLKKLEHMYDIDITQIEDDKKMQQWASRVTIQSIEGLIKKLNNLQRCGYNFGLGENSNFVDEGQFGITPDGEIHIYDIRLYKANKPQLYQTLLEDVYALIIIMLQKTRSIQKSHQDLIINFLRQQKKIQATDQVITLIQQKTS